MATTEYKQAEHGAGQNSLSARWETFGTALNEAFIRISNGLRDGVEGVWYGKVLTPAEREEERQKSEIKQYGKILTPAEREALAKEQRRALDEVTFQRQSKPPEGRISPVIKATEANAQAETVPVGLNNTQLKILTLLQEKPNKYFSYKEIADQLGYRESTMRNAVAIIRSAYGDPCPVKTAKNLSLIHISEPTRPY